MLLQNKKKKQNKTKIFYLKLFISELKIVKQLRLNLDHLKKKKYNKN